MAPGKRQRLGILLAVVASALLLGIALTWRSERPDAAAGLSSSSGLAREQAGAPGDARHVAAPEDSEQAGLNDPALGDGSPVPAGERTPLIPEQAFARLNEGVAGLVQQRLEKIPNPVVPGSVGGFSQESLEKALGSYREMLAYQGLYNQKVERARLMDELLASPDGTGIAEKTLTDFAFTKEAFGELQAEARYFSIEVLKKAARQGNDEPLMRTASRLAGQLSLLGESSEDFKRGRGEDLYDLIAAYIEVVGVESLATADAKAFQRLGYSPGLPPQIKKTYDDALFFRLNVRFGRTRAVAITSSLLDW